MAEARTRIPTHVRAHPHVYIDIEPWFYVPIHMVYYLPGPYSSYIYHAYVDAPMHNIMSYYHPCKEIPIILKVYYNPQGNANFLAVRFEL